MEVVILPCRSGRKRMVVLGTEAWAIRTAAIQGIDTALDTSLMCTTSKSNNRIFKDYSTTGKICRFYELVQDSIVIATSLSLNSRRHERQPSWPWAASISRHRP